MTDLRAFGYAPGNYMNRCCKCQQEFQGDKLARTCLSCAELLSDLQRVVDGKEPEHGGTTFKCNPNR